MKVFMVSTVLFTRLLNGLPAVFDHTEVSFGLASILSSILIKEYTRTPPQSDAAIRLRLKTHY